MASHIIFVHGLGGQYKHYDSARKEEWQRDELTRAWASALRHSTGARLDPPRVQLKIAWWADEERNRMQSAGKKAPPRGMKLPMRIVQSITRAHEFAQDVSSRMVSHAVEPHIKREYWAMAEYFADDGFRSNVRATLRAQLESLSSTEEHLCVVAHSMGTVVAYDVLSLEGVIMPDLLITMGSPLGMPFVRRGLEHVHQKPLVFPAGLGRWVNVYDRLDMITQPQQRIARLYPLVEAPGAAGRVVQDSLVGPVYSAEGRRDPHHWFGYLSCTAVGEAVAQFLLFGAAAETTSATTGQLVPMTQAAAELRKSALDSSTPPDGIA